MEYCQVTEQQPLKIDRDKLLKYQYKLARTYESTEQVDRAGERLEQLIKIQKRLLEPQHPSHSTYQHELARAYYKIGQVKRATELLENFVYTHVTTLISGLSSFFLYASTFKRSKSLGRDSNLRYDGEGTHHFMTAPLKKIDPATQERVDSKPFCENVTPCARLGA